MIDLFKVAAELQAFCDARQWQSCFIGGIAVQRWSEPRVTRDVDLTLLTGFGREETFIDELLASYQGRISDAKAFAERRRVLLLQTQDFGIDISLGALAYEELAISRASLFTFPYGLSLRTCSAEDLIVMKLLASRPLDIRDAEGVAIRHQQDLDWRYIEEQLRPLVELKEDPSILLTLARLRTL